MNLHTNSCVNTYGDREENFFGTYKNVGYRVNLHTNNCVNTYGDREENFFRDI